MAARRRKNARYNDRPRMNPYIDGSAVRQEDYYDYEEPRYEERRQSDPRVRSNQARARHWNLPYVTMLLMATGLTVMICYQYLQLQSSITMHKMNIASLESSVTTLRASNDATEDNIELYTNLEHIYDVAVNQYGMEYPKDDQVIEYEKSEGEYVRQYDEIPTQD